MTTNLEIIRAACIKAKGPIFGAATVSNQKAMERISLADVLLALCGVPTVQVSIRPKDRQFVIVNIGSLKTSSPQVVDAIWNLLLDDLAQQSPETLQFLADLLK